MIDRQPNKSRQPMPGVHHDCIRTPLTRHGCAQRSTCYLRIFAAIALLAFVCGCAHREQGNIAAKAEKEIDFEVTMLQKSIRLLVMEIDVMQDEIGFFSKRNGIGPALHEQARTARERQYPSNELLRDFHAIRQSLERKRASVAAEHKVYLDAVESQLRVEK